MSQKVQRTRGGEQKAKGDGWQEAPETRLRCWREGGWGLSRGAQRACWNNLFPQHLGGLRLVRLITEQAAPPILDAAAVTGVSAE